MKQIIRYQTKPEATQRNIELVENVFREVQAAAPQGVRYLVLRAEDGTFFHIVDSESEAANAGLTGLPAFAAFSKDGGVRRVEPPVFTEVTVVGNYRMLAD
jgi:hypothetical protein